MKKYRSSPFYSTVIIPSVPFLVFSIYFKNSDIIEVVAYLLMVVVILYIISYFSLFTFENQEGHILKNKITRPFWAIKKISYDKIYSIEIRHIVGSHQLPYVLLHFNKKDEKSLFFYGRSFTYNKNDGVENFIEFAQTKGVHIKINIDSEYKEEIKRFKRFG